MYAGILLIILAVAVIFYLFFSSSPSSLSENKYFQTQTGAGISVNGIGGDSAKQLNQKFADISKLGFTWVRLDIAWFNVQPHSSRSSMWGSYDVDVRIANQNHLKVLGILDYAPAWAAQNGCTNHGGCAPKSPAQFAHFAADAAGHYKQSIQDWEIWNEENISQFWSPAPSAKQYASVLKQSYKSIKAANPAAKVILGGMAAGDNPANKEVDAVTFLQQLYQDGAKGSFDAVAYHPYTYPRTSFDVNTPWNKLVSLRGVMQAHGDGDKQIWITEYGAPTNGPAGSGFVSEAAQAQIARDAYESARSKPWIGPFFWYTYQDPSTSPSTKENFFGIRRADGTPKPAYYTWQQLLTH
ncbi:MAG TPA: cellulase family glycosylhydrolase [Verrucomicrobiae bacterium]|jgi:hypothetical protein|nr:cellulase family glycosylhydrolase [Verrucomicrobiae bacterium]